ncbi:MAG: TetR family transcriptional regulator [Myxococcales bacterium]|nr:TetR family transcriptional regulator [Myxococcales bacterium]
MEQELSLRDKKKAAVREALIDAALRLFRARGFDAVTIDEIAAAAEVSRRSFFRYFPTKEAVLLERRHEQLASFRALLAAPRKGEAPFALVRRACLALATEYVARRKQILEERTIVAAAPSLVARDLELDRAFEGAIEEALGGTRRARICAAATIGVTRVVLEDWAASGARSDLLALGGEALDLLEPLAPARKAAS